MGVSTGRAILMCRSFTELWFDLPATAKSSRLLKRWLDVVAAAGLLFLTLPFLGLIALAIKLDSPGPILFRQRRFVQEPFTIFKFRTMYFDACHDRTIQQARPNDTRVTRTGRVLRRCSFDESATL